MNTTDARRDPRLVAAAARLDAASAAHTAAAYRLRAADDALEAFPGAYSSDPARFHAADHLRDEWAAAKRADRETYADLMAAHRAWDEAAAEVARG